MYITFLGIPVILMSYTSSVIPIIISTYIGSKLEAFFRKVTPSVVRTFLVPFFTLLVTVPLALIAIGPVSTWAGQLLGQGTLFLYNLSPVIEGLLVGAFWQVFVIFGLHWGLVPIALNNMAVLKSDPILAASFGASFAQTGAVLAIMLRTKNAKLKSLSIPAIISGIFGVTEPAIYGITLPRKKPFILSCVAAAVGGGIVGLMGTKGYILGGLGIFGIPSYISPDGMDKGFYGAIAAIVISFILGFILVFFSGFKDEETADSKSGGTARSVLVKQETVGSPLKGQVRALSELTDEAFSTGAMGKGIAIEPLEGKVYSPVDGVLTTLFASGHAIGITSDNGVDILIHVGKDTVKLKGKHFTPGPSKATPSPKASCSWNSMLPRSEAGYTLTTPVIISNSGDYLDVIETDKKSVDYRENLLTVMI